MLVEVGLSCRCVCSLFCSTAAGGLITSGSVGVQGWVLGTSEEVAQMFPAIWPDPAWQNRYLQMFFIELENSIRQRNSEQHLPGLSWLELGTWGSLSSHPASCLLQCGACLLPGMTLLRPWGVVFAKGCLMEPNILFSSGNDFYRVCHRDPGVHLLWQWSETSL